jgi:hypothetical protein
MLMAMLWLAGGTQPTLNWLSLAAVGYTGVVALNTLMLSPAYTPAGLYHPLLLLVALMATRSLSPRGEQAAALAACATGVGIAVWGFIQVGWLSMARAQALFESATVYATLLNLILVPMLAAILVATRAARFVATAGLLSAGLFAADSRGGLLALAAGLGVATILGLRAHTWRLRGAGLVILLLVIGWMAAAALRAVPSLEADRPREPSPGAETRAESSLGRLELYSLSWSAWQGQPLAGTGYLTFRYVQEQGRVQAPSFGQSRQTWFVHNDYLQTLQELGVAGLAMLLGLTALPLLFAYRRIPRLPERERPVVVMTAAALASMAAHALVDFPFYVPACLLLYGALLGVLENRLALPAVFASPRRRSTPWYRAIRSGVSALAIAILLRPVAAEAAAEWGLRELSEGHGQGAALWLGVARRIDPADWRYHWYAGQFWDSQAAQSGKREAARLAATSYAEGFDANPLEVRNLLGMISVHHRHRHLLDEPADAATLEAWMKQAAVLAPMHPAVRREPAR